MEPWYKRAGDYMLDAFTDIDTSFKGARADAREWASPVTDWMRDADSELMDGIRHYLGPHAGPPVQAALKYGPEMFGPGADVRDMTEGSSQFAQALMNRDYSGALEGGALMAGGTLMAALPGPSVSSMKRGVDEVVDALPMDEASRMARADEMGFDTSKILYHGTPDVRGIDADGFSTASERLMGDDRSGPYYFTNRKQTAATYADDTRAFDYQNAEPEIIEAFVAQANPLVIDAKGSSFREGIDLSELREQMPDYSDLNELRMGFDSATGRMMVHSDQMSDLAKLNGYDGVVIRNIRDEYNGGGMPSDVYMVFNPSKIRRTTAKFDPAKRDSRDLTAGLAMPVAAGSALALALQGYRNEQGDDGTPIYRREQ